MKSLLLAVLISSALGAPALAFAEANHAPVSRATASDPSYPSDIEAAQAKVAAQNNSPATQDNSPAAQSVGGGAMTGSSRSGAALTLNDSGSIYAHH
jgi:hypothetical protein